MAVSSCILRCLELSRLKQSKLNVCSFSILCLNWLIRNKDEISIKQLPNLVQSGFATTKSLFCSRFSHRQARYFSLLVLGNSSMRCPNSCIHAVERKVSKRKDTPHTALNLRVLPLPRVFRRGIPAYARNAQPPCCAPFGLFLPTAAMLGAV